MVIYGIWPFLLALLFCAGVLIYVLRMRSPKVATVIVGPVFLYLVAAVLGSAQLYFMGTMVLSVCVVAYLFSVCSLRGLAVSRTAGTPVTQGEVVEIRIEVENRHRLPKLFLRVHCPLPEWLRAERDTVAIAGLWPGQRAVVPIRAHALKRGCYPLPPVQVIGADPLDLFPRAARFPAPQEVVVHPVPDTAPSLELLGDDLLGTVTPRRPLRAGHGLDFHGLREYRPGDDIRAVDWKATARLSRLITVEFEPTQVGDLVILLDNRARIQAGAGEGSTLERAVSLAAGAAVAVLDGRGSVHLRTLVGAGAATASGHAGEMETLLDALARVDAVDGTLERLAMEDVRGRTVLLITAGTGPEVAGTTRQAISAGGRAVVLLLDRASFTNDGSPGAGRGDVEQGSVDEVAEALYEAGALALVVGMNGLSRERSVHVREEGAR